MKRIYGVISEDDCLSIGYFLTKQRAIEEILTQIKRELQTEEDHQSYYIVEENLYEENE